MDVSENKLPPKSSILVGFSIIHHPFWGTPIFGNTRVDSTIHIGKYTFPSPWGKKNSPGNLLAPWRAEILGASYRALEEVGIPGSHPFH